MSADQIECERKQKDGRIRRPCKRADKAVKYEEDNFTNRSWDSPKASGKENVD